MNNEFQNKTFKHKGGLIYTEHVDIIVTVGPICLLMTYGNILC